VQVKPIPEIRCQMDRNVALSPDLRSLHVLNRVPTEMTEANFSTFEHYKSRKIMTYSSIRSANLYTTKKTMDIKLPVSIIDAKTMLNFTQTISQNASDVCEIKFTYLLTYFINGLLFQYHILKISWLFQHIIPNSGLLMTRGIKRWLSGHFRTRGNPASSIKFDLFVLVDNSHAHKSIGRYITMGVLGTGMTCQNVVLDVKFLYFRIAPECAHRRSSPVS